MQKNIILLNDFDIVKRPRPYRMIEMLKDYFNIYAIARECSFIPKVKTFSYPADKNAKQRSKEEQEALETKLKAKNFLPLIYTPNRRTITKILDSLPKSDLIIVEDITLLPFASDYKNKNPKTKILIDLREYYPLEYENNPQWLETFGNFFYFLCKTYLKEVDFAITVSEGIAKKYFEIFNLRCEVFYSLPPYFDLNPSPLEEKIKIVYHGFLSPDRNSHFLVEIAKNLEDRFHLYILGLSNQANFLENLQNNAPNNISFIPPVAMQEIIPFTNQFDLGILTLSPNSFNNANAMPNKFFEYIQARLGIITTPLPSLLSFISQYKMGVCSTNFSAKSIASSLNSLDKNQILKLKLASHKASETLNYKQNQNKILRIINSLIKP
ncbi:MULTISPECIES: glycosyltransferase [unclassified Helicobacter]|uniref:glycosyltransferase n=1 Tax=unclassified Helicobacter TaxID=2593540 RepID=UPI000CF101A5|nr:MULTISPECIES: glycosyltransferase [unclassified Helicobacter]